MPSSTMIWAATSRRWARRSSNASRARGRRVTERPGTIGTVSPTPGALEVRRASDDLAVSCTKDGYKPARVTKSAMDTQMLGGASALIDMASGANYSYPPRITVELDPAPAGIKPRR